MMDWNRMQGPWRRYGSAFAAAILVLSAAAGAGCDRNDGCDGGFFDDGTGCSAGGEGTNDGDDGGNDDDFFNNPEIKFCNNLLYNDDIFAARLKIGVQVFTANTAGCSDCFRIQTGNGLTWELQNFSFGGTIASGTVDIPEDSSDLIFMADIVEAPDTPGVFVFDLGATKCEDAEVTFEDLVAGEGAAAQFGFDELDAGFVTDDRDLYTYDVE